MIDLGKVDRETAEMICQFLRRVNGGSLTDSGDALMRRLIAQTENKVSAKSLMLTYNEEDCLRHGKNHYSAAYLLENPEGQDAEQIAEIIADLGDQYRKEESV